MVSSAAIIEYVLGINAYGFDDYAKQSFHIFFQSKTVIDINFMEEKESYLGLIGYFGNYDRVRPDCILRAFPNLKGLIVRNVQLYSNGLLLNFILRVFGQSNESKIKYVIIFPRHADVIDAVVLELNARFVLIGCSVNTVIRYPDENGKGILFHQIGSKIPPAQNGSANDQIQDELNTFD